MPNPSLDRRWLQVAGLPPTPTMAAVRSEIDAVTRMEITPHTSRVLLFADKTVIGALDLTPEVQERIAKKMAAADQPETRAAAGDTIIRDLDLSNPEHRAALEGPRILHDPSLEPPPLELPDYDGPRRVEQPETTGLSRAQVWGAVAVGTAAFWGAVAAAVAHFF